MFEIAKGATKALDLLYKNGYEAFLVGGCVRDFILKRPFNDYDITTNALPEQIKQVFSCYKTIDTGIKHGTVTVLLDDLPIEITTYRIDGEYEDNRHPKEVIFSESLREDLSRRDFTVNALAYNGNLIDYFNGLEDINNKIIRCVGNPDKRFNEDGLRIMRCLRFASVLGFDIEKNTARAVIDNRDLLNNISVERIYAEFSKLLNGKNARKIIEEFSLVFAVLFDGVDYSNRGKYIEKLPTDSLIRTASFFLDDSEYKKHYKFLKPDNKSFAGVCNVIEGSKEKIKTDKADVKRFLLKYGKLCFEDILEIKKSEGVCIDSLLCIYREITDNNECFSLSSLNVSGNDIALLGVKGENIGFILSDVLENVIDEKIINKKENIIKFIKEKYL